MAASYLRAVVVLVVSASVASPVSGAPPYTTRHPHREPPCTHPAHATLCWTVQLKQPLHFNLQAPTPDNSASFVHSVIKASNFQLGEAAEVVDSAQELNLAKVSNSGQQDGHSPDVNILTNRATSVSPGSVSNLSSDAAQSKVGLEDNVTASPLSCSNVSSADGLNVSSNAPKHLSGENAPVLHPSSENDSVTENAASRRRENSDRNKEGLLSKGEVIKETPSHRNMDVEGEGGALHRQKMYVYHQMALLLAEEVGLILLGTVGELYDHFVLCHEDGREEEEGSRGSRARGGVKAFRHYHKAHTHLRNTDEALFEKIQRQVETSFHHHHDVAWFAMEMVHHRQKRSISFNDPAFIHQWHLVNRVEVGMDVNVTGVWETGFIGTGVTVAVVDDGLEWNNPDLHDNYNFLGSWDLNDNDPDPMPNAAKVSNHHGTRCAGEIAAVANNTVCGIGVAYGAKVSGIRLLDGPMTDSLEAEAFNKKFDVNAIYSCSWGPDDDGKTVDGPHLLAAKAMKYGVEFGRNGYGSVFVVASGNGGSKLDNCNYDGYANSIYTVTIGAVDESGAMPYYAEECASMLGVTFSSGTASKRDIVTTDWQKKGGRGCTDQHTGTSAAAPLAAGMIALMLNAQPCLTWRDVQYILIITSVKIDVDLAHWQKNGAGLEHSHKHGFGLIKAWRLVNAARVWRSVPWMTSYANEDNTGWDIHHGVNSPLIIKHTVTLNDIAGYSLYMLEYVQVTVTLSHPVRGKLGIHLRCPSGTLSVIGAPRPNDNSTDGFKDWTFTTVRCWGEAPTGDWTLVIADALPSDSALPLGRLTKWRLTLFGTPMTTEEFQERRRQVEAAMSGEHLASNFTPHCDPPPVTSPPYIPLSEKTLKILFLSSVFCLVFALYETMEYILCYNDEKRQQQEESQRAMTMTHHRTPSTSDQSSSETARLLRADDIEQNSEWLRQSQSAFDEEEDDMFLLDGGIGAGMWQARHKGGENGVGASAAGEAIPMSTFRASLARSGAQALPGSSSSHRDNDPDLVETPPAKAVAKTLPVIGGGAYRTVSPTAGAAAITRNAPNQPRHGASVSNVTVEDRGPVEIATETHGEGSGGALHKSSVRSSILPDMWRALTQDPESDNDSLEEELFSRGSEASVSLLHNGAVSKSYR